MNEQHFYETINRAAKDVQINPLLLLSGIEGLYSFRDVPINAINYELLDCLILTIFALRIGDKFHSVAEENLRSQNNEIRSAANRELSELSNDYISNSSNSFLQSFAQVINGKSIIRRYHEKALEVAALEIKTVQDKFQHKNIGTIILAICKTELNGSVDFGSFFAQ